MKNKVRKLLESFLEKPTEQNLEIFNESARGYITYWIEAMHSGEKLEIKTPLKKIPKYKRKFPKKDKKKKLEGNLDGFWYVALQERIDVPEPFWVISFRALVSYNKYKNVNRRFNRQGDENWFFFEDMGLDTLLGPFNSGWFDYEDHRRPKDIPLEEQYIDSRNLNREEKLAYMKDIFLPEECIGEGIFGNFDPTVTFFDAIDDVNFCIDLYAGDATGDKDGKNWRKVIFNWGNKELDLRYSIRSLTTDEKYRPSIMLEDSSARWRIDNSMPDISPQTAKVFFKWGF